MRLFSLGGIIELIVEVLLTAIWEILLQLTGELLLEFGFNAAGEAFRRRSRAHPIVAAVGITLLGGVAGVVTSLLMPSRIISNSLVPGLSLVLSPIVTGSLMEAYGRWRMSRGVEPSYVATFTGGALFAFAMAVVRFLLVAR